MPNRSDEIVTAFADTLAASQAPVALSDADREFAEHGGLSMRRVERDIKIARAHDRILDAAEHWAAHHNVPGGCKQCDPAADDLAAAVQALHNLEAEVIV